MNTIEILIIHKVIQTKFKTELFYTAESVFERCQLVGQVIIITAEVISLLTVPKHQQLFYNTVFLIRQLLFTYNLLRRTGKGDLDRQVCTILPRLPSAREIR